MIHGHSHPYILKAIKNSMQSGLSFGAPTRAENDLARLIKLAVPQIQKLRFTSSGTEATMTAIRLARGVTGRSHIVKFVGCYHGHYDSLLVDAGSGLAAAGELTSHGVLKSTADCTIALPYNDIEALELCFEKYSDEIAGVIVEPIAGNMGCVLPKLDFLKTMEYLCKKNGALFIVDEVMTGFRVALGGATELFNLDPDLITLGKIVGGGMPLGALGGKNEYMKHLSPEGSIYHAGTLSGNPTAVAAGIATLELLFEPNFHQQLHDKTKFFAEKIKENLTNRDQKFSIHSITGMITPFYLDQPPINYHDVQLQPIEWFYKYFQGLLDKKIYWPAALFETGFISSAHTYEDLEKASFNISQAWAEGANYYKDFKMDFEKYQKNQ
jgi:glutamate-1-semialdehyde 2,1-aminomutase